MKKSWKIGIVLASLAVMAAAAAGCGTDPAPTSSQPSEQTQSQSSQQDPAQTVSPAPQTGTQTMQKQTATLSIGTNSMGFNQYPLEYEGELTPEVLIQGIEKLTNWNLELAKPTVMTENGIVICFAEDSMRFVGLREPQKEEFHVFGIEDLAETLLDSVQKTLRDNLPNSGNLAVYYQMADGSPLTISGLEMTWPADQSYAWERGQSLT